MIIRNLEKFNIEWIRKDKRANLSKEYPEADAFQKICGSIINDTVYKEATGLNFNLIGFPLHGRDGSIDSFSYSESDGNVIMECKKNNTVKNCLSEIKKLQIKLIKNLSIKSSSKSIYSPWFSKNLKYYIFCTSCEITNANEFETIIKEIKLLFKSLATLPELYHLNFIEIKVYCWNHLKNWLEQSPNLMFQWVEPGIEGIEYFSEENLPIEGYQSYLSSNKIPYSRRDDFMLTHPEINSLPSERKYLETLFTGDGNYKGIIIYGQGGIGKTRLMCELALMAKDDGWKSYLVKSSEAFKEINTILSPGGKYIILIDYIEEFDKFLYVISNYLKEKRPFEFKFIINCRTSYFINNKIHLDEFIPMDISDINESTHLYYSDLIDKITENIPYLKDLDNNIFEHRPSFAVFVRYLFETNKHNYYNPIEDIKFQKWLTRRLDLSIFNSKNTTIDKELVAKIFCCLPAYGTGLDLLEHEFAEEVNVLISDGWCEKKTVDGGNFQLSAIHDSITDEILIAQLKLRPHTLKTAIEAYFLFAAKFNLIGSCIRAFERIFNDPIILNFDFFKLLGKILNTCPDQMRKAYFNVAHTSLISNDSRVELYAVYSDFFKPFISSVEFGKSLFILLESFYKKEVNANVHKIITDIFNDWCNKHYQNISWENAALITYSSIRFFGLNNNTKQMAIYCLDMSQSKELTFLIYIPWMEAGGEKDLVYPHLKKWLQLHSESEYGGKVIQAWLNAGGDKFLVETAIGRWLLKHVEADDAYKVIGIWLNTGGNKTVLKLAVEKWLAIYCKTDEADFILTAWLDAGGEKNVVVSALIQWLTIHCEKLVAFRVIGAWLVSRGETTVIKPFLKKWLALHIETDVAYIMMNLWLTAGGDNALIESAIKKWLSLFNENKHAIDIIKSWINAGGDKSVVGPFFKNWLELHGNKEEAGDIINSWLGTGGDISTVESSLKTWLAVNNDIETALKTIISWITAGGEKSDIIIPLKKWLELHCESYNAIWLVGAWLNSGGDKQLVALSLEKWLSLHSESVDAHIGIVSWLNAGGDKSIVASSLAKWLAVYNHTKESFKIIVTWLKAGGDRSLVDLSLKKWLNVYEQTKEAHWIMSSWLDAKGDKSLVISSLKKWMVLYRTSKEANWLIASWLKAGGKKPEIGI